MERGENLNLGDLESARVENVRDAHTLHSKTIRIPSHGAVVMRYTLSNTAREVNKVQLKAHARSQSARRLEDVVRAVKAESQRADDVRLRRRMRIAEPWQKIRRHVRHTHNVTGSVTQVLLVENEVDCTVSQHKAATRSIGNA